MLALQIGIALLFLFVVWIGPAMLIAKLAARKGHGFGAYLLIGLVLSWIVSGIAAATADDRRA